MAVDKRCLHLLANLILLQFAFYLGNSLNPPVAKKCNQLQEKFYPRKRSIKTAPYGYCLVAGQLHPDPREQITLQLIIKWWQQGLGHCAITKSLNKKKIKPRKAKEWSQPSQATCGPITFYQRFTGVELETSDVATGQIKIFKK